MKPTPDIEPFKVDYPHRDLPNGVLKVYERKPARNSEYEVILFNNLLTNLKHDLMFCYRPNVPPPPPPKDSHSADDRPRSRPIVNDYRKRDQGRKRRY